MTKAEDIYQSHVTYEWNHVSDNLKKSIISAINKALTIPVVDYQRELLKAEEPPIVKGEKYVADYVAKHGKDLTSL